MLASVAVLAAVVCVLFAGRVTAMDRIAIGLTLIAGGVLVFAQGWPLYGALIGAGLGTGLAGVRALRKNRGDAR